MSNLPRKLTITVGTNGIRQIEIRAKESVVRVKSGEKSKLFSYICSNPIVSNTFGLSFALFAEGINRHVLRWNTEYMSESDRQYKGQTVEIDFASIEELFHLKDTVRSLEEQMMALENTVRKLTIAEGSSI